VNGGALPVAVASAFLLAAWDQNVALDMMSPAAAHLDARALDWIVELLGLPPSTGGGFVTGASMANASCLAAARDAVLRRHGWDAAALGLVGAPPIEVFVGAEAHTTVHKALGLIGLGRDRARRLPVDDEGRIIAEELPAINAPAIVCLQAGNVNSGGSDPFVPLIDWARSGGAWVHVDGAFGLWAAASPAIAHEVAGVELADSWATDAHKWLNTTYDCGIALVREPEDLAQAMQAAAAYLPHGAGRDPMRYTPQTSQRARGVEVWAVLASLGREGLAALVAASCGHARRFAAALEGAGHTVLNTVHLNQVVVDFGSEARNAAVIAALQEEGTCWCGPTHWRGRAAMRISVSCWATSTSDVEASIDAMLGAAERTGSLAGA
jgi:glutamate/tyrosine decarboxylase-like PLP-dependent enzyme